MCDFLWIYNLFLNLIYLNNFKQNKTMEIIQIYQIQALIKYADRITQLRLASEQMLYYIDK